MSATVRSLVYLAALARHGLRGASAVVIVEILYVTLTAGIYAGMQQGALQLRSRWIGNLIIVLGVPVLAQFFDWAAHRAAGAEVAGHVTTAVGVFAIVSAFFHLHVMRNGVFLTGGGGSLFDDFRRIPRLIGEFALRPWTIVAGFLFQTAESEGTP